MEFHHYKGRFESRKMKHNSANNSSLCYHGHNSNIRCTPALFPTMKALLMPWCLQETNSDFGYQHFNSTRFYWLTPTASYANDFIKLKDHQSSAVLFMITVPTLRVEFHLQRHNRPTTIQYVKTSSLFFKLS